MKMKYYYKIDHKKHPIPGSNIRRKSKPGFSHQWKELKVICCTELNPIPCTCGARYFVQLDSQGKPVDGSLIKRLGYPRMEENIKYQEVDWRSVCCVLAETPILGFGGSTSLCVGETATFFIDSEVIGIGTTIYESDQYTPVNFITFRDDATGILYDVVNGVITGVATEDCSQLIQIFNGDVDAAIITGVKVNNQSLVYVSGDPLPLNINQIGQYRTSNSSPGYKTIDVTITGSSATASIVNINDSEGNPHNQPFTGAGTYTFPNVYVSGPNEFTAGVAISLS